MTTYLNANQVSGDKIGMLRTDPRHFDRDGKIKPLHPAEKGGFEQMLLDGLNGVNDLEQTTTALSQKMIVDPDSVDPHDLTIAMAKAQTALSLTRQILERGIKAYNEIINIR